MFYVYVLKSLKDKNLYLGYTNDLKRRFAEHNKKANKSTKHRIPFQLVYYEAYRSIQDAQDREKQLKRRSHSYSGLRRRIQKSLASEFSD